MDSFTAQLVISLVSFILGNVSGYLFHDFMKKTLSISEADSKNFLVLVVTTVWAIGMIVGLVNPSYQVPLPTHGILGVIVGFFFYKPKDK